MTEALVTIVVVPRERFAVALRSLDSLLTQTSRPFELLYVDGNSPAPVAKGIRERAERHSFAVIRRDHYLTPNQARNLAFPYVKTKYVVSVDNDVLVTPGWLEAMLACAEETNAALVGPLVLQGELEDQCIHMATGSAHFEPAPGGRTLVDDHHEAGRKVPDLREPLVRAKTELVEFHCMLLRTDFVVNLGGLDEELQTIHEHTDLCLQAQARGEGIYFEPRSVVTYLLPTHIEWSDAAFFRMRWADAKTRASLEHFSRKWELINNDPGLDSTRIFVAFHRRSVLKRLPGIAPVARAWSTLGPARRAIKARWAAFRA